MKISDIRDKLKSQLKEQHPQAVRLICEQKDIAEAIKSFLENVLQNQSTQTSFTVEQDGNQYIVTIAPEVHQACLDALALANVVDEYRLDTLDDVEYLLLSIALQIITVFKKNQQLPLEEKQTSSVSLKNILVTLPILKEICRQVKESTFRDMVAFLKNGEALNNLSGSLEDMYRELRDLPENKRWYFFQLVLKNMGERNNLTNLFRKNMEHRNVIPFIAETIDETHHLDFLLLLKECKGFTSLVWFLLDFVLLFAYIKADYFSQLINLLEKSEITIDTQTVNLKILQVVTHILQASKCSSTAYHDFFKFLKTKGLLNNLTGSLKELSNVISHLPRESRTVCANLLKDSEVLNKLTEGGTLEELLYVLRAMMPSYNITTDEKLANRWNMILSIKKTGILKKVGLPGDIDDFLERAVPKEQYENFIAELPDGMQCLKLIYDEEERLRKKARGTLFSLIPPFCRVKINILDGLKRLIWEKGNTEKEWIRLKEESASKEQIKVFLKERAEMQFNETENKTNEEILETPYYWFSVTPKSSTFLKKLREKIETVTEQIATEPTVTELIDYPVPTKWSSF